LESINSEKKIQKRNESRTPDSDLKGAAVDGFGNCGTGLWSKAVVAGVEHKHERQRLMFQSMGALKKMDSSSLDRTCSLKREALLSRTFFKKDVMAQSCIKEEHSH
jgi:hypothetical protein